ncbi:MAG: hemolysin D [Odoribacter sp.]|nr:hemolysin D [Odoribacter sp.]
MATTKGRFSDQEDIANALSHLAGAVLSIAALVLMIVYSALRGNAWHITSSAIFGFSMVFLYSSSSVAHWLPAGKRKDIFFTLDRLAIFILIAGTYTPLSLVALRGALGWIIFGVEWGLAIIGIIRLLSRKNNFESGVAVFDILIYIIMGWLVVLVSGSVLKAVPVAGFVWIIAGGLFYTLGIIFFKIAKFRFHHLIWHLLVLGGTASHFIAIFFFILP